MRQTDWRGRSTPGWCLQLRDRLAAETEGPFRILIKVLRCEISSVSRRVKVRLGARRPVPAARAERLLCDQTADLRRDARQWARRAGFGHSDVRRSTAQPDPQRPSV